MVNFQLKGFKICNMAFLFNAGCGGYVISGILRFNNAMCRALEKENGETYVKSGDSDGDMTLGVEEIF